MREVSPRQGNADLDVELDGSFHPPAVRSVMRMYAITPFPALAENEHALDVVGGVRGLSEAWLVSICVHVCVEAGEDGWSHAVEDVLWGHLGGAVSRRS